MLTARMLRFSFAACIFEIDFVLYLTAKGTRLEFVKGSGLERYFTRIVRNRV